ncbi:hypothetical protein Tco_1537692 [Tanacetum coccineum]
MFLIIIEFISSLGYDESGDPFLKHSDFKLNKLSQPRKKILTIINRCTTKKDISLDKARQPMLQILWGVVKKQNIDYVKLIWEDLEFQFKSRRKKRAERVLYPHYTKIIISHFMSQHNTIYKRTNEPQRTPQFDDIVQRMKTEGTVIYGTRLPEELLNEVVKSSMACKTYEKEMRKLGVSMTQPQPAEST